MVLSVYDTFSVLILKLFSVNTDDPAPSTYISQDVSENWSPIRNLPQTEGYLSKHLTNAVPSCNME